LKEIKIEYVFSAGNNKGDNEWILPPAGGRSIYATLKPS
jgi:hypothetical protein